MRILIFVVVGLALLVGGAFPIAWLSDLITTTYTAELLVSAMLGCIWGLVLVVASVLAWDATS